MGLGELALAAQLFAFPVTNAYAQQVKDRVVVMVTYVEVKPTRVCVSLHDVEDETFDRPQDTHCFVPDSVIGSFDTWEHTRLDDGNFKVTVVYPDRPPVVLYLVTRINT